MNDEEEITDTNTNLDLGDDSTDTDLDLGDDSTDPDLEEELIDPDMFPEDE